MVLNKMRYLILLLGCLWAFPVFAQQVEVSGTVTNAATGEPISDVNIVVRDTNLGTSTNDEGYYSLQVPALQDTLVFSFIGYESKVVPIRGRTEINVQLQPTSIMAEELVVMGYGVERQVEDVTAAVSSVSYDDIESIHNGATITTMLAGQIPGLSFRQAEGRPGASASISIRNMGTPLIVIDGVVKDMGQFNNLSPYDIKNITVLKDASAAIYGSRAANGVILVTTKGGELNSAPKININFYTGWQNWTRYPTNVLESGYKWKKYAAIAQLNAFGQTGITQKELQRWKEGTDFGFKSFDWADFIINKNAPQTSINVNASGGTEHTTYYISVSRLKQLATFDQYNFNRTNIQSNVATRVGSFKFSMRLNGRVEKRTRPGIPGVDDYWQPLFAIMRNRPTIHPYANFNPEYMADIGHNQTNAALWNYETSGKWTSTWRVLQTNFKANYEFPVKGLTAQASYSYYFAHNYLKNHEFTYKTYTYDPATETYNHSGGSSNPWQERSQQINTESVIQAQLNYNRSIGKHRVGALLLTEWYQRKEQYHWLHVVPPVNESDIIRFNTMDQFDDTINDEARIGFVGMFNYEYNNKYYFTLSGRYDASWKFPPNKRWGFFPSVSAGWRISEEPFFQALVGEDSILGNVKLRVSYGILGDDDVGIGPFDYIPGYNYAVGTTIFEGRAVNTIDGRGVPITNITWFESRMFNAGVDFGLFDGKITGSFDYFYRKRVGLLGAKYDVVIPSELGYSLPPENLNSDAQMGGEIALQYHGNVGRELTFNINFNMGYSRHKFLHSYKPRFGNSWDRYRWSGEQRWTGIYWGYQVIGQFQSQEQINNYPVNVDGLGNTSLIPGDFIYKDVNKDGVINGYDVRPIGWGGGQPMLYGGIGFSAGWKGFNLLVDFSFASGYSINRDWEGRWPFQNTGNLLKAFLDRWHRVDPFDLNSEWVEGKYPALRYNTPNHSNYNKASDWWLLNITYLRLRTVELSYTLPQEWTEKLHISDARIFVNGYNLLSFDNAPSYMDPEVASTNALQYPQSKYINVGVNLTF